MAFGDVRGTLTGNANNIGATLAISTGGPVTVRTGDLIYAVIAEQATASATACIDNLGNGPSGSYNTLTAADAGTICTGRGFWAVVTVAGSLSTVTFTTASTTDNVVAIATVIEGPFTLSPLDANPANITNDTTTPYTCPTTSTLSPGLSAAEVVMCWFVHNGSVTLTATSPNLICDTFRPTQSILTLAIGHQTVTATTAVAPAWTSSVGPTQTCLGTTSFKSAGSVVDTKAGAIWDGNQTPPTRKGLSDKVGSKAHIVFDALVDPIFIPPPTLDPAYGAVASALVLSSLLVYDSVTQPVFPPEAPAVVETPFVHQPVDPFTKPVGKKLSEPVAGPVLPPAAAPIVTSPADQFVRARAKRLFEPFAWSPRTLVAETPAALGYQALEPYAKPIKKRQGEPFAWNPQTPTVVVATPDIFGYQTVPPYAQPQRSKPSEAFAWEPQTITAAAAAPTVTGALGGSTTTVRNTWLVYDAIAWTPQPIVAVVAPPTLGYQPSDLLRKWRAKRRQSPSSFVFAIPIDDYGFAIHDAYAKPIPKRLSEPFAWSPQEIAAPPAGVTYIATAAVQSATIINTIVVYDAVAVVITPPTAVVTTPDAFGYQTIPSHAKPVYKRLSEAFAWDPQTVSAVVPTPDAFGYQPSPLFAKPIYKRLSEPFIWAPQSFIPTFGFHVLEPYAKPVRKKLSEAFAWDPRAFVPTPSEFGYQTVEPFAKPIFKRLSEAFAWGPQSFVFAPTPDIFGYQDVAPFAKPTAKKLSEPFIWDPQFVEQLPPVPPVVGGVQPPGYWYEEWKRIAKRQRERKRPAPEVIVVADRGVSAQEIAPYEPDKTFRVSPAVIAALAQAQSIEDIRTLARQETGQVRNMLNMIIAEHKRRMKDEADVEIILLMS